VTDILDGKIVNNPTSGCSYFYRPNRQLGDARFNNRRFAACRALSNARSRVRGLSYQAFRHGDGRKIRKPSVNCSVAKGLKICCLLLDRYQRLAVAVISGAAYALRPERPTVFLIGDRISEGYTAAVQKSLPMADVHTPAGPVPLHALPVANDRHLDCPLSALERGRVQFGSSLRSA